MGRSKKYGIMLLKKEVNYIDTVTCNTLWPGTTPGINPLEQKDLKKELDNVETGTRKERSPSPIEIVGHMVLGGSKLQTIMKNKSIN